MIDGEAFREFISTNPSILYKFISSLSKKIKILETRIENIAVLSGKEKVAKFIYQNWNNFKKIKKRVIAESLNITPEHLSRILRNFKDAGLIDKNGNLVKEKMDLLKF
jgi:CRP/FNR family transcriptional regulator